MNFHFWLLLALIHIMTFAIASFAEPVLYFKSGAISLHELKSRPRSTPPSLRDSVHSSRYFVLQYKTEPTARDQAQLEKSQVPVLRYIPDSAYVVYASSAQLAKLQNANAHIMGFADYHPDLRVSEELRVRHVFNSENLNTLRLQLFANAQALVVAQQVAAIGATVLEATEGVVVVRAPVKYFERLAQIEGVEWLSTLPRLKLQNLVLPASVLDDGSNLRVNDFNTLTGYESGTRVMHFDEAWARGLKGSDQIVTVADTGLDTGDAETLSPDFKNYSQGFVLGYGSRSWADFDGHGTHVTGSVGSVGLQSNGKITGGAVEARLIMQSLWSVTHETLTTPGDLRVLFRQAYGAGARIHTNSWGDPESRGQYNVEASQVDQFVWDNPDMVILFAAGNDGVDADADGRIDAGSVLAPSTAKNIVSVGASENLVKSGGIQAPLGRLKFDDVQPWPAEPIASDTLSNNPNGLAAFSSRGPTLDGRIKPDLVAPGSNILSDCSQVEGAGELWGRFNADYCFSGGTSMSTPLVAGGAALVRQHLQKNLQLQSPSAALVKAVMLHNAADLYPGQFGEVGEAAGQELLTHGPNNDQGYGRFDVAASTGSAYRVVDEKAGVSIGQSWKTDLTTRGLRKVTLVYTDAPGSPAAQKALVNNLDLEVQVNGQVVGKSESRADNTEQVVLAMPSAGSATIVVKGTNVAVGRSGRQPFALVYSMAP